MKHLLPRSKQKLLSLQRSNPSEVDDGDNDGYDDTDIHVGYRRPDPVCDGDLDQDNLSDYVIARLALARARAMERYRELNG